VRRLLPVEGPYGPGLTTIEVGADDYCRQPGPGEAGAVFGRSLSVPMLRKTCDISIRRVAAHMEAGQPLDLSPVEDAAEAVAMREEEVLYHGQKDFAVPGLLTAQGRNHHDGGDWSGLDQVIGDVLSAITKLDESGARGPYALVLEPALYNGLFRRYPDSELLQVDHLQRLCQHGIHKANISGGLVLDPRAGVVLVGQDLQAGYQGQDGIHYSLYLNESVVLRLDDPSAICTISTKSGK